MARRRKSAKRDSPPQPVPRPVPKPSRLPGAVERLLLRRQSLSTAEIVQALAAQGEYGATRESVENFCTRASGIRRNGGGLWSLTPQHRIDLLHAQAAKSRRASAHTNEATVPGTRGNAGSSREPLDVLSGFFGHGIPFTVSDAVEALRVCGIRLGARELGDELESSVRVRKVSGRWQWNPSGEEQVLAARSRHVDRAVPASRTEMTLRRPTQRHSGQRRAPATVRLASDSATPHAGDVEELLARVRQRLSPSALDGLTCAFCDRVFAFGQCNCGST